MTRIYFNGTREELDKQLAKLGDVISGKCTDVNGLGLAIGNIVGMSFLASTVDDFKVKARGGCGEVGGTWAPLQPETIARRKLPKRRRVSERDEESPTEKDMYDRKAAVNAEAGRQFRRLKILMPEPQARTRAKQIAENKIRRELGVSKKQSMLVRQHEILIDESYLINSLSPGFVRDGIYYPLRKKGSDLQRFEIIPGKATVGTNRIGAATHQYGYAPQNIPARPFFPKDQNEVPQSWWDKMRSEINEALPGLLKKYFAQ